MREIAIRRTAPARLLVRVDVLEPEDIEIDHIDHLFTGVHWNWREPGRVNGAWLASPHDQWTIVFEFSDGSRGVSRTSEAGRALAALDFEGDPR